MNTTHTRTRIISAALLLGVLGLAGFELAPGNAQAAPCSNYPGQPASCAPPEGSQGCYDSGICSQEWCPNMGPMRRMPNWDMNVCHTYYFAANSGLPAEIIQGEPPGLLVPRQVVPHWLCPGQGAGGC
jgi:hypothetical protein